MDTRIVQRTLIAVVFASLATPAVAVPVVFTNVGAWNAAVAGSDLFLEDFESAPLGQLPVGATNIGLFDITIDNNDEGSTSIAQPGLINGSREFQGDIDNNGTLSIDFSGFNPSPIIGFAGMWGSTTTGDRLTMTINGVTIHFDNHLPGAGNGFLGVVDTDGFSIINFGTENPSTFGEFFQLDNAQLAAPVPEPAMLGLIGIGVLALRLFGWGRQR